VPRNSERGVTSGIRFDDYAVVDFPSTSYETSNVEEYSFQSAEECRWVFSQSTNALAYTFWPDKYGEWVTNCFLKADLNGRRMVTGVVSGIKRAPASYSSPRQRCNMNYETMNVAAYRVQTVEECQAQFRSNPKAVTYSFWSDKYDEWAHNCFLKADAHGQMFMNGVVSGGYSIPGIVSMDVTDHLMGIAAVPLLIRSVVLMCALVAGLVVAGTVLPKVCKDRRNVVATQDESYISLTA